MSIESVLVRTMDEAAVVLEQMTLAPSFTYDTETSGLDWLRNHVVAYVIKPLGYPSYYIPVRHAGGGNVPGCKVPMTADGWKGDLHPFEILLAKWAKANPTKRLIGHFLDFDLKMSLRHSIIWEGPLEDTWINFSLLDENARSFSLDSAAKWCEVIEKKGEELYDFIHDTYGAPAGRDSMSHYWMTPGDHPLVVEYGGGDGVTTEKVWAAQQMYLAMDSEIEFVDGETGELKTVDWSLRKVHAVESRLIRTLFRMTARGIRIDEEELHRVDAHFKAEAERLRGHLPKDFNPNSPLQMKALFKDHIDDPNWPRTAPSRKHPQGQPQFNEAILKTLPVGRDILAARKMQHAIESFTQPMINTHLFNGRVYCGFNQMKKDDYGTVSGRLSSSNPNLQQVPKRDKAVGKPYRKIFLPDDGGTWVANDYKQQEYVIFTDYTQDPVLVAGYTANPPVDIHQSVADMLGVERDPTAKRMNLGMLYGMGKDALAGHLGVPLQQAVLWQQEYHSRFPGSKKFLKGAEQVAKRRGFVMTYLRRRRRFPDTRFCYKAGNAIIQGSSADVTKAKMVEIDDYFASEGDICQLMLQVHDSLDWDEPAGYEAMSAEAQRIMTSFGPDDIINLSIPLGIDSTRGRNWSEATYG